MGAAAAAGITAVGSIAGAAISSSSKGGGNQTSGSTVTDASHTPWGPQGNAIQAGLGEAQGVYSDRSTQGPYTGALYAGTNGNQAHAQDVAADYANGPGSAAVGNVMGIGGQANGALGTAVGTSSGIANGGIGNQNAALASALAAYGSGQKSAVSTPLADTLHASATAGASTIGGYNAGLQGVLTSAQQDPTQQLAGDAQTYMNSGATQAMLDNVNGQIDTTLNETTVPGLNRAAAMGGNLNSSRAGMAEAMANRDAALAKGNADSQILNNAYNTGLGVASSQRTAGLNTAASAATAGLTGNANLALGTGNQDISSAQTAIGAANSGLSQETSHQTADASARLQAAGQLNTDANTAVGASAAGQQLATNNASLISAAGQQQQSDSQAKLNEDYAKWKLQNEYGQGILTDYMNTVTKPSGYYDSASSTNTTSTPPSSIGTLIAGGATALGSQFKQGGIFNSKNADGSANSGYVGNWFGGGNNSNSGFDAPMQMPVDAPAPSWATSSE